LWASQESLAAPGAITAALAASGDDTARSSVFDVLRRMNWPAPYNFRALRNTLHRQWEQRVDELRANPEAARAEFDAALAAGDFSCAHVTVGEGVGLMHDAPTAAELVQRMTREARAALIQKAALLGP
jgi:nitronate monooxygenase